MDLYDIIAYIVLMAFLVPPIVFIFFGLGKHKLINVLTYVGFVGAMFGAAVLADSFSYLQWVTIAVSLTGAVLLLFVCIGCVCFRINNPRAKASLAVKADRAQGWGDIFKASHGLVRSRIFIILAVRFLVNNVFLSVSIFDLSQGICPDNVLSVLLLCLSAIIAVLTVLNARGRLGHTDIYGVLYITAAILGCIANYFARPAYPFKGLSIGETVIDVVVGCTYILAYFYKADENTKQK